MPSNGLILSNETIRYDDFIKYLRGGDTFFIVTPFKPLAIHTYLSYIIRAISGTPNHCAIHFDQMLYGAKQHGVMKLPLFDEIDGQYVTVKRRTDSEDIVAKKVWCESMLGKKYDVKSLIWYELVYYTTGVWMGKTGEAAKDEFFCYEYAACANNYEKYDKIIGSDFYEWYKFYTVFENVKVIR